MLKKFTDTALFYRLTEAMVPFLTWVIITLPIWLSPFHPAIVAYFILAYFLYFFYKTVKTVYFAGIAYQLMQQAAKIPWYKKLQKINNWKNIRHFIVITNYKESTEKVAKTIRKIQEQDYDLKKIHVVLAMEEREESEASERSNKLTKDFGDKFGGFYTTYHRLEEGEVVGKASNESFAARLIDKLVNDQGWETKEILLTICDADSLLPSDYLSYLTLEFLKDKDKQYHFYWAPVLPYNNFWQLPLPIRVQSILSSIVRLSLLPQRDDLIQISTYSTSLWLLKSVGFWDVDIIPEDWHIWLQAFFKHGKKVKTLPIYLPISADAVLTKNLFSTFRNRYEQERRWAWGATDIPYAIKKSLETPDVPFFAKLKKIFFLIEIHLLWPTAFFILTLSAWIPGVVNRRFAGTVMGFILPRLSSVILTATSVLLLFMLYFDHKVREQIKVKTRLRHVPILFIQWYLLPIISFLFSSLPALEAHTRILLGKKLEYKVTEKV